MKLKTFLLLSAIGSCQTFIEAAIYQQLNYTAYGPQDTQPVVCRDNGNRAVDWFILYKEPNPSGSDYIIITNSDAGNWKSFPRGFATRVGAPALANTFRPLSDKRVTYAMYSDQPPTRSGAVGEQWGHVKGVVAKLGGQGFLVTHTLPNFPFPIRTKAEHGWSYLKGQIFLCVSFAADRVQWDRVLTHFSNLVPFIYEKSADWRQPTPRSLSHIDLFSLAGTKFTLFSKYGKTGDKGVDIYEQIIAQHFRVSLAVATWRNGNGEKLRSQCTGKKTIEDVTEVQYVGKLSNGQIKRGMWNSTKDHSKWTVSLSGRAVFCSGDMNRMTSQTKRNGGAVCFENTDVVRTFRKMVKSTECKKRELHGRSFNNSPAENEEWA